MTLTNFFISATSKPSSTNPSKDSHTFLTTLSDVLEEALTVTTKLPEYVSTDNLMIGTTTTEEPSDVDNDITTESSDKLITTLKVQSMEDEDQGEGKKPLPQEEEVTTSFPIETMEGSELTNLIQLLTTMNSVTSTSQNNGQDKEPSKSDDLLATTTINPTVSSNSEITTTTTTSSSWLKSNFSGSVQAEIYDPVDNNTIPSHVINHSSTTQYVTEVTSTRPYINKLGNISFDS